MLVTLIQKFHQNQKSLCVQIDTGYVIQVAQREQGDNQEHVLKKDSLEYFERFTCSGEWFMHCYEVCFMGWECNGLGIGYQD